MLEKYEHRFGINSTRGSRKSTSACNFFTESARQTVECAVRNAGGGLGFARVPTLCRVSLLAPISRALCVGFFSRLLDKYYFAPGYFVRVENDTSRALSNSSPASEIAEQRAELRYRFRKIYLVFPSICRRITQSPIRISGVSPPPCPIIFVSNLKDRCY